MLRIVTGVPARTSVHQIYIEQNILPMKHLYTYNVALFIYKHSNYMLPLLFDHFFCKVSDIRSHYTRKCSSQHLCIDFHNTTLGQKMSSCCGAIIRKFILNEIDPNYSIDLFKKDIWQIYPLSSEDILKKLAYKFYNQYKKYSFCYDMKMIDASMMYKIMFAPCTVCSTPC